jgi:hypothetical protein
MEQVNFDFGRVVDRYTYLLAQLHVKINGGVYTILNSNEKITYHGLNYANEIRKLLAESVDPKLSYVALRDADRYITDIQEIRLDCMLMRSELKSVVNRPELTKNPAISGYYKALKLALDTVCDYLEVCDKQYSYMTEILFGVSQVNVSINRRFFGGSDMMYDYKN